MLEVEGCALEATGQHVTVTFVLSLLFAFSFALWTLERPFFYFLSTCARLSYIRDAYGCNIEI